jgi:hypothetical protein
MCPDPQLLSIYMDGEMPSPWKEKLENHLEQCSLCREKLNGFRQLFNEPDLPDEQEFMETAKNKVWQNLAGYNYKPSTGLWRRRINIPLPAAAAAAVILVILTAVWTRGGPSQIAEPVERMNFSVASEETLPVIPAMDMNGILQYLSSDSTDIIILRLPENSNFVSSGEPAIIRAADYRR